MDAMPVMLSMTTVLEAGKVEGLEVGSEEAKSTRALFSEVGWSQEVSLVSVFQ